MQAFGCLEHPVAECYKNNMMEFGSYLYRNRETIHNLVDDSHFALIFSAAMGSSDQLCACAITQLAQDCVQLADHER